MIRNKNLKLKPYLGYKSRIISYTVLLFVFVGLSLLLLNNILSVNEVKVINYEETGNIDYKVNLKPNDFYEEEYLDKNMVYIASLIKNIDIGVTYNFLISEETDIDLSYEIVGRLSILDETGKNTIFEKEYVLLEEELINSLSTREQKISKQITLDYDYYNSLASSFKATYGVEADSNLTLYVRLKKNVSNIKLEEENEMTLTIPLTQKTINISMNDKGIDVVKSITEKNKMAEYNKIYMILFGLSVLLGFIVVIKLSKLLLLLFPERSKYDKYLNKLLNEYDRLIVETTTTPNFDEKNVIKINKFEELLDVRDNLKRPIIYHNLVKHHKAYFYVDSHPDCYLFILKATDIEEKNEK